MELRELHTAIGLLLEAGDRDEEPVCLETPYGQYMVDGLFTAVVSDSWVPDTIVLTVKEVEEPETG